MTDMSKIHTEICPSCGSQNLTTLLKCKDHYASGDEFEIIKCEQCGLGITQDFPSEEEIGKYYDVPQYISHSDTNKGLINRLYHIARTIALKSKAKTVTKFSSENANTLLDMGCGTGYFLNKMRQQKWLVTGIEKDAGARKYAKDKFNLDTHTHEYLFDLAPKKKDVITLWHVLEHLEKLNETMAKIHEVLNDDGIAIIALPNKDSFDAIQYKEKWAAYDVPRHLWHFSPNDFELLANKHNFKLEELKPMYFDAFYISMLSEKYRNTFAASIVGLCRGGFYFLRTLFCKKRCSSIIYILRKA